MPQTEAYLSASMETIVNQINGLHVFLYHDSEPK